MKLKGCLFKRGLVFKSIIMKIKNNDIKYVAPELLTNPNSDLTKADVYSSYDKIKTWR